MHYESTDFKSREGAILGRNTVSDPRFCFFESPALLTFPRLLALPSFS
jgi:hypothetical protein